MTAASKGRVSLRVDAAPDSVESALLNHIKADPIAPSRAVMLRALKAFYLPWALEGKLDHAELRSLAQSAIEELEFRIFQIRQRYLADETSGYTPAPMPTQSSNAVTSFARSSAPAANSNASNGISAAALKPNQVAIQDMRQSINPADLDDF